MKMPMGQQSSTVMKILIKHLFCQVKQQILPLSARQQGNTQSNFGNRNGIGPHFPFRPCIQPSDHIGIGHGPHHFRDHIGIQENHCSPSEKDMGRRRGSDRCTSGKSTPPIKVRLAIPIKSPFAQNMQSMHAMQS